MVLGSSTKILGNLVDVERGEVSREIFTNEDLYQQQLERIFARAWLFVGHVSQIPNANDFFISRMGEESVIMTRDRQGEVHVLLNTCRHRGMKVCRYDEGNTPVFSCPYHGWSYSTDGNLVSVPGELIGVPQFATAYHGELEKEDWGLVSVAKMHIHKGSVWACWDKDAPDWDDYMGDMKLFLDGFLDGADGTPGEVEVIPSVQKFIIPSAWMYGAENFIGDSYHGISHRSVDLAGISPQAEGRHTRRNYGERLGPIAFPQLGHGMVGGIRETADAEYLPSWPNNPEVDDYYREAQVKRQEQIRKGQVRYRTGPSTVFPNASFHSDPQSIFVWHPAGPMKMEMWRWFTIDKKAPEAAKDALRRFGMRYSGPGGMTEQDDAENWNYATAASSGTIAHRYKFNYEMGLGHLEPVPGVEGATRPTTTQTPVSPRGFTVSENNARTLYRRWAEFMDAESWADLFPIKQ
jgi:phenylpropionate dioxygenase-like ring-hydroxylating dioxygenase large terminal subunit